MAPPRQGHNFHFVCVSYSTCHAMLPLVAVLLLGQITYCSYFVENVLQIRFQFNNNIMRRMFIFNVGFLFFFFRSCSLDCFAEFQVNVYLIHRRNITFQLSHQPQQQAATSSRNTHLHTHTPTEREWNGRASIRPSLAELKSTCYCIRTRTCNTEDQCGGGRHTGRGLLSIMQKNQKSLCYWLLLLLLLSFNKIEASQPNIKHCVCAVRTVRGNKPSCRLVQLRIWVLFQADGLFGQPPNILLFFFVAIQKQLID